jgi:outer membrane cobalamin receptor
VPGGTTGAEVTGTGNADADSQSSDGVPIEQIGAAVTVVTRKDLARSAIRPMRSAACPAWRPARAAASATLRRCASSGAEVNQTLVLIDGVEANNPTDGEFDFSNLATADIERIEIIRGPMSGVYGSSAVGGVIQHHPQRQGSIAIGYDRRKTDGFNTSPFGSGLSLGAAYTYLNARKPDDSEAIPRPPHSGPIDVNYAFLNKGNVNFAVAYTGQHDDFAFRELSPFGTAQERVTLASFWLATVAANYRVAPGVELFGRVENVFDDRHQEVYGFQSAPVAAFVGVRLT